MSKLLDGLEKSLNRISEPIQPLLPSIARFLLVVTWLEDSLRIFTQWQEQVHYIEIYGGYSNTSSSAILALLVIMMMIGSILAILKIKTPYAVGILFSVIIIQGWIYGLYQEAHYIFRNLSITGGLVLLLADYYNSTKNKNIFAGIPTLSAVDKSTYLQLAGRILLIFLFISVTFFGEWSFVRLFFGIFAFIGMIMVVVGFKAKMTAMFMTAILSLGNIFLNNWWSLHHLHPERDFRKYDFFQILSVVGGLLLLADIGPGILHYSKLGDYSLDEQKKMY